MRQAVALAVQDDVPPDAWSVLTNRRGATKHCGRAHRRLNAGRGYSARKRLAPWPVHRGTGLTAASESRPADGPPPKIRTIHGPTPPLTPQDLLFPQVNEVYSLYHQQTKNLLVSYSAKKLGFF